MWSSVVVLNLVFSVIQSITVPTAWPKVNSDFSFTQSPLRKQYTRTQPSIPLLTLLPAQQRPQFVSTVPSAQPKFVEPSLQFRSPNIQEVYINHPPASFHQVKNTQYKNYEPKSYQIVHFDNQNKDLHSHPRINSDYVTRENLKLPESEIRANQNKPQEKLLNKQENEEEITDSEEETSEENVQFVIKINEHEFPQRVPTKPIFPGEGQWAKHGLKHMPYVNHQQQAPPHHTNEKESVPEGYDTFETGQEQFQEAQNKFHHNLSTFPQNHQLKQSQIDDSESEWQPLYKNIEMEFVPKKLYTQVRKTETKQHLPRSEIDLDEEDNAGRLREVIKDSKIQTVYTEEGYEDSAYDHAGHEKQAENSESQSELAEDEAKTARKSRARAKNNFSEERGKRRGHNSERSRSRSKEESKDKMFDESARYKKSGDQNHKDSVEASSNHELKKNQTKIDGLSKNMKKIKVRNGDKEEIDMEIHTEIKYVSGPQRMKHKFVKIIPSFKKYMGSTSTENVARNYTDKKLKRVKRYDKNQLTKKFVRKRPSYYWKKKKTTTTERPLLSMRRKFEARFKTHNKSNKSTEMNFHETTRKDDSITKLNIAPQRKNIETTKVLTDIPLVDELTSKSSTTTSSTAKSVSDIKEVIQETIKDLETSNKTLKLAKSSKVKIRKFVLKREKRYTIDHPNIDVDLKEFTDVRKLNDPTDKPDLTFIKYPYYNLPITDQINENSPLRYAEDIKNIPKKTEDLSFYKSRAHIVCPEVKADVDSVPNRAEKQEEKEEIKTTPRLKGLGDTIDCFKEKYFGENPLDSPFFQEQIINTPIPFFVRKTLNLKNKIVKVPSNVDTTANMQYKTNKYDNKVSETINLHTSIKNKESVDTVQYPLKKLNNNESNIDITKQYRDKSHGVDNAARKRDIQIKILEPIVVIGDDLVEAGTINPIHQKAIAVLKPPFTLLEMMNMNLKRIQPRPTNIYDQITIIKDLDGEKESQANEEFVIVYDKENVSEVNKLVPIHSLETKINMIKPAVNGYKVSDIITDLTHDMQQQDILNVARNVTTHKTLTPQNLTYSINSKSKSKLPQKVKIHINKNIPRSSKLFIRKPQRKVTTNQTTMLISTSTGGYITALPVTESPTFTNFQMPKPVKLLQGDFPNKAIKPSVQQQSKYTKSEIDRKSSFPLIFDISKFLPKIPNHKIITSEVHYKDEIKPSEQMRVYSDVLKTINEAKEITQERLATSRPMLDKLTVKENSAKRTERDSITSVKESQYIADSVDTLIGLTPPPNGARYSTLQQTIDEHYPNFQPLMEVQNAQPSQTINYYYVPGMKPPPQKKKILRIFHKLSKRDTSVKTSITPNYESDNLMMDESKISKNFVVLNKHQKRKRRDLKSQTDTDDLIASESRSYEVTPLRKPIVYKEIVRAKPIKPETVEEPEEEEENLNPRKRIFELKPTKSETTENTVHRDENIFEEIPEVTEPPTTRTPVIYPVEANSDNPNQAQYVFLIERLHKKLDREKPVIVTTEEIPVTTQITVPNQEITQTVAESINVGTGEPAFLQIISHLHEMRQAEEKKNATSQVPVSTEEITASQPAMNTNPAILEPTMSDSFLTELIPVQIRLNSDEERVLNQDDSSRTRNFSAKFKTSIDTSKYKTIERSPMGLRHNLSSRYNAEDQELPLSSVQTTQLPIVTSITTHSQPDNIYPSTDIASIISIVETTTKRINQKAKSEVLVTTTGRSRLQTRPRSRPTTSTMHTPVNTKTNSIFRRRRPSRTTTTEATISTTKSESLFTRRRSRFRPESRNRTSTSEKRTRIENPTIDISESATGDNSDDNKMQRKLKTIHERRVVSEVTLTRFYEPNSDELVSSSNENVEESKKHQYQIISPFSNTNSGHGGNYRHKNDQPKIQEITVMTDTVAPSETFYSDSNLAVNVNQLKDNQNRATGKYQALNSLLNSEENKEKILQEPLNTEVNLYSNMARMVNRLSDVKAPVSVDESAEDEIETGSSTEVKPAIIKDPSRRLYYYASL